MTANSIAAPRLGSTSAAPISWSTLYGHRKRAARRLGDVYDLPLAKRVRDLLLGELGELSNTVARPAVLEVGAGDRSMGLSIAERFPLVGYQSLDIDPQGNHDYHDWSEVDRQFDAVFAFEVIEHLPIEAIPGWLDQIAARLAPGGRLLISTPNTYYPPAYLRDATHRTPLCYDELAGLVSAAGLEVDRVVRIYHDPVHRKLLKRFAFGWLFRLLGFDYARQIVLVAHRCAVPLTAAVEHRAAA